MSPVNSHESEREIEALRLQIKELQQELLYSKINRLNYNTVRLKPIYYENTTIVGLESWIIHMSQCSGKPEIQG